MYVSVKSGLGAAARLGLEDIWRWCTHGQQRTTCACLFRWITKEKQRDYMRVLADFAVGFLPERWSRQLTRWNVPTPSWAGRHHCSVNPMVRWQGSFQNAMRRTVKLTLALSIWTFLNFERCETSNILKFNDYFIIFIQFQANPRDFLVFVFVFVFVCVCVCVFVFFCVFVFVCFCVCVCFCLCVCVCFCVCLCVCVFVCVGRPEGDIHKHIYFYFYVGIYTNCQKSQIQSAGRSWPTLE